MNNQIDNILFWISFVGIIIFIVNSVHATIVLRLSKTSEFKPPDMAMTSVTLTLAVIFVALAISNNVKKNGPVIPTPTTTYKSIELHTKTGQMYIYDPVTKKNDTVEIYRKK